MIPKNKYPRKITTPTTPQISSHPSSSFTTVVVTVTRGVGAVVTVPVSPKHEHAEMYSAALAQLAA